MKVQTISLLPSQLHLTLERVSLPFAVHHSSTHQETPFLYIQTHGFCRLCHPELIILLLAKPHSSSAQSHHASLTQSAPPASLLKFFRSLYRYTQQNQCLIHQKDYTEFSSPLLGVYKAFVYSDQPLPEICRRIPSSSEYLVCIGITESELVYVKKYGTARILANLARMYKYYPTPCWMHPKQAYKRNVFHLEENKDKFSSLLDAVSTITWPNVYVYVEDLKYLTLYVDVHTSPQEVFEDLKEICDISQRELGTGDTSNDEQPSEMDTRVPLYVTFAIKSNMNADIPAHLCWRGDAPPSPEQMVGSSTNAGASCIVSKPGANISSQLGASFLALAPHDSAATFRTVEDGFCLFLPPQDMHKLIQEFMSLAEDYVNVLESVHNGNGLPFMIERTYFELSLSQGCTFRVQFPSLKDIGISGT
mmetsp:Transcript_2565/g.9776  ORF Transcript_2565/g.9776 Transcript_2565/m.9776 type:complete len:420 (+) Transcript_2565:829-2088(+)